MKNKLLGWLIVVGWAAALFIAMLASVLPSVLIDSCYTITGLWLAVFSIWSAVRLIKMDADREKLEKRLNN